MADSYHSSVHTMLEESREAGESTAFDRMDDMGTRCKFCEQGIRCSLCSQGPCRLTEKSPRGVCGIDADGMAMRNFLLQNTMGTATYTYHANEVMKTLAQAKPGGTYEIKDWSKLETLAGVVGEAVEPRDTLPKRVGRRDHRRVQPRPPEPVAVRREDGPAKRVAKWKELGILPGGVLHENMFATSSCLTNVDGSYVSLALKGLRLGVATAYGAQIPLELAQDALSGHADAAPDQGRPRHHRPRVRQHRRQRPRADGRRRTDRRRPRGRRPGQGEGGRRQGSAHRRLHRDRPGARAALRGRRRVRRSHRQLADGGARGRDRRPRRRSPPT